MWPPFLRWCHFLGSFRWDNESIGKSTTCQLHLKVFQWILWGNLPGGPRVLPSFWASEPQVIPSWSMVAYAGVTCRMQRDGWRMGFYGVLALGSWGWAICRNLRKWEGENAKMWGPNPVAVQWLEKWSLRALEVAPGSHLLWWSGFAVPLVKHGHGRVLLPVHVLSIKLLWMFDCCRFLPENMLLEVCVGWLADFFIQISQESFVTIDSLDLLHSLDTQVLCEHGECLCTSWCYGGSGAMAMRHGEGDQKRDEKRDVIYTYTLICMYRYQYQYVYIYIPSRYPIGITRDGRSGIFNWLTVYIDDFAKKIVWHGWGFKILVLPLHVIFINLSLKLLMRYFLNSYP